MWRSSSCAELETQLIVANDRGYVADNDYNGLEDDLSQEGKMLNGLIGALVTDH